MNKLENDVFSLKSVTKDTKAKFDALLKASLLKKSSTSKEKLVEVEIQSISSVNEIPQVNSYTTIGKNDEDSTGNNEITTVDIHSSDKDFIINKFFRESSNELVRKVTVIKSNAPVPKPRKSIINNEENNSASSRGTYEIRRSSSVESNGTYKVDKSESNSRLIIENSREIQIENVKENLVEILSSDAHAKIDKQGDSIELQELSSSKKNEIDEDGISYEDELDEKTPRPRTKRLKKEKGQLIKSEEDKQYNYENIICINILKTNNLELDSFVVHPVVKIHLVDVTTGKYLLKSSVNRSVLFYYENKDIQYIGPILTESYNLQKHRSMNPNWNESIIINEDFKYFMDYKDVILLFEIMDFLNISTIQSQRGKKQAWHKIAWAFLRHTSPLDGTVNVNKKLRLQLYRPGPPKKCTLPDQSDIFHWWKNYKWIKYPSTLHVTINELKYSQCEGSGITIRSKTPLEAERSQNKMNFQTNKVDTIQRSIEVDKLSVANNSEEGKLNDSECLVGDNMCIKWSRSFYQTCKIPNTLLTKLEINNDGCFLLSFSNDGTLIACAVLQKKVYSILIYSIITFEEKCFFSAHQDFIYSISWSKDDRFIITGSADWTVCIWDVTNKKYVQMLPHPSFVYSSIFSASNQIATGCFDKTIRIWSVNKENVYELHQELEGHAGYITALCFTKNGNTLFSGDSLGVLKTWKIKGTDVFWNFKREYNISDIKGLVINEIILHPRERRLFIYSRDNYVRLIDLKNDYVMQQFSSEKTNRTLRHFTISPCFTLLFCPSDQQGKINIWNINSTKLLASCKPFDNDLPVHCVRFHPFDNILALSQYSSSSQHILLYKYEENPIEIVRIEYYDTRKTLGVTKNIPPKKPERLNIRKTVENHDGKALTRRQDLLLDGENNEYKKNLRQIIEKMDKVIEGKFELMDASMQ